MKPPLNVLIHRGRYVESLHQVLVCLIDHQGKILESYGDVTTPVYLRSAAKPFQALAFLESGAAEACLATTEEIALACASHLGREKHVQIVQNFLQRLGIDPCFLQNHEHEKNSEKPYRCEKRHDDILKTFQHNCSGKHAAFLATQKYWNEPLVDYLLPESRLQKRVLQIISDLAGCSQESLAETLEPDGCGAPIFCLPLHGIARLYAALGAGQHPHYGGHLTKIYSVMARHPDCMRGEGDFNTELISAFSGRLVAKVGYEGVYGLAFANGAGLAIKVIDGHARALAPSILAVLQKIFSPDDSAFSSLQKWIEPAVRNVHQVNVGKITVQGL